jgi:hypothetical protein
MKLKYNYYNKRLADILLNIEILHKSFETPNRIIQKYEPVYMKPVSKNGRAHFFAPYKLIGNLPIDTFRFNVLVLWFVTLVLYIILYYNLLQRLVTFFENLQFAKSERQKMNLSKDYYDMPDLN